MRFAMRARANGSMAAMTVAWACFRDPRQLQGNSLRGRLAEGVSDAWCEAGGWPCDWPGLPGEWGVLLGIRPLAKYLRLWRSLPGATPESALMQHCTSCL